MEGGEGQIEIYKFGMKKLSMYGKLKRELRA